MNKYYQEELRKRIADVLDDSVEDPCIPTIVVTTTNGSTKTLSVNLESIESLRYFLDVIENNLVGVK